MEAIVYSSAAGHTARYAKLLSEKTGIPLIEAKNVRKKLCRGDEIIYMGWVMAGVVDRYMEMFNHYTVRVLCPVGIMPAGEGVEKNLRDRNLIPDTINTFYLRGGFDMSKIRGFKKIMAKSFRTAMEMDFDDNGTPESGDMFKIMTEGAVFFDEAALDPVIECIERIQKEDAEKVE